MTTLDPFQTKLLAELRAVVTENATTPDAPSAPTASDASRPTPPPWRRPLVAAAPLALVAGAVGVSTTYLAPPAYALEPGADTVKVTINKLEGAQKLQADLADLGIKAVVDYTPAGTLCKPGCFTESTRRANQPVGVEAAGSDGVDTNAITLPRHLLADDETFVLESSWVGDTEWTIMLGIADGPVGECEPIPVSSLPGVPEGGPAGAGDRSHSVQVAPGEPGPPEGPR